MSKAVLISIQPKWCQMIASGKKTIEVRKTKPKIDTPFKCYIYCTQAAPDLVYGDRFAGQSFGSQYSTVHGYSNEKADKIWGVMNGKVIGEFVCDKIDEIRVITSANLTYFTVNNKPDLFYNNKTCLQIEDYEKYLEDKPGYGWHISDLVIYDQPRELETFKKRERNCFYAHLGLAKRDCADCRSPECMVHHPPQSWCYVEDT